MKKRFICYLMFALLLFPILTFSNFKEYSDYIEVDLFVSDTEADEIDVILKSGYSEEFYFRQMDSNIIDQNLLISFDNCLEFNNIFDIIYPEFYAGSYIDDNGNLVVLVNGDDGDDDYNKKISEKSISNDFILMPANYSYNYLNNIMNIIGYYKLNNDNSISNNYDVAFLNETENRVYVLLNEYNDIRITEFKENVTDSDAIVFLESEGSITREISPGDSIQVSGSSSKSSIGYRATLNGRTGFVMTGHHGLVGDTVRWGGRDVGEITRRNITGSVDAAFVTVNGPFNLTNNLPGGFQLSTALSIPTVGSTVFQVAHGTGLTSSNIISNNVMFGHNTNLCLANYTSSNSDSGGVVYNVSGSNRNTFGILGRITSGSNAGSVYCKSANISNTLGVTRY